jgi:hypothetical protein
LKTVIHHDDAGACHGERENHQDDVLRIHGLLLLAQLTLRYMARHGSGKVSTSYNKQDASFGAGVCAGPVRSLCAGEP